MGFAFFRLLLCWGFGSVNMSPELIRKPRGDVSYGTQGCRGTPSVGRAGFPSDGG